MFEAWFPRATAKVVDGPVLEALEHAPNVALTNEEAEALELLDSKGPWSGHEDVLAKIRSTSE